MKRFREDLLRYELAPLASYNHSMNQILTIIFALVVSPFIHAETMLFTCKPPFSLFNQGFQQGDEVYVDIYVNAKNQTKITYATSAGPTVTLYDYNDTNHFHLDLKKSSSVSEWKNETYLSAVYMGSHWGAVLKWTKPMTVSTFKFEAGQEQDLLCQEADFFNGL